MKKKIPTLVAVIVVFVAAGVAGGSVLLFNQSIEKKVILGEEIFSGKDILRLEYDAEMEIGERTEEEAIEASNFANWNAYRNEKYGFEFQYPNFWHIVNDDCAYKDYIFLSVGVSEKESLDSNECSFLAVDIVNDDWRIGTRDFTNIEIGEIYGQMDSLTCQKGCLILVEDSDIVIRVLKNPIKDEITNKIISTFRFLD